MAGFSSRLKHAWNVFSNQDVERRTQSYSEGTGYGIRPDRPRLHFSNERSIISSIYTRLSVDCASIPVRHIRLDENDRYIEDMTSGLSDCLKVEANIDQAPLDFFIDVCMTLFDKGVAAIVPVETTINPETSGGFDIKSLRVGEVVAWFPRHVKVSLYNERRGIREDVLLEKKIVGIVYNPLYSVMNEPNSTLQRLIRKLNLLDAVDDASASGKLDLIIQLPYVVKSEAKREQAEQRAKDLEFQLKGSKYGIAYTDGTEKITQLNRPAENNLLKQIEYLTEMLYGQLGLTPEIMLGTAEEAAMLNYYTRTIGPIMTAIVQAMRRSFLTKTARSQKQWVDFFRDPFKLVPIADLAEIADKFTRNEIATSNEMRQVVGWKPAADPKADELINSNMPVGDTGVGESSVEDDAVQSAFDGVDATLDSIFADLGVDEDGV